MANVTNALKEMPQNKTGRLASTIKRTVSDGLIGSVHLDSKAKRTVAIILAESTRWRISRVDTMGIVSSQHQ